MKDIQPVSDNIRNILGEGPVWDAGAGLLLWTDIEQSELWMLDSSGEIKVANAPGTRLAQYSDTPILHHSA